MPKKKVNQQKKQMKMKLSQLAEEIKKTPGKSQARSIKIGTLKIKMGGSTMKWVLVGAVAAVALLTIWKLGALGAGGPAQENVSEILSVQPVNLPEEMIPGQEYQVPLRITNRSKQKFAGHVRVHAEGLDYDYLIYIKLAPGESQTIEIPFRPVKSGTNFIEIAGRKVALSVAEPSPGHLKVEDLRVAPESVILDPDKGGVEVIHVLAKVMNDGQQLLQKDVTLYAGLEGYEEPCGSQFVKLAPGESQVVSFTYTITADQVGELEEGEERNVNIVVEGKSATVKVSGYAKFEVKKILWNWYPTSVGHQLVAKPEENIYPMAGDKVEIIFRVKNVGTAGGTANLRLCINATDIDTKTLHLKRGEEVKENFIWYPPAGGSYEIEITGDEKVVGKVAGEKLEVKTPPTFSLGEVTIQVKHAQLERALSDWRLETREFLQDEPFMVGVFVKNDGDVSGKCKLKCSWEIGENEITEVIPPGGDMVWMYGRAKSTDGPQQILIQLMYENRQIISEHVDNIMVQGWIRQPKEGDKWIYKVPTGEREDAYQGIGQMRDLINYLKNGGFAGGTPPDNIPDWECSIADASRNLKAPPNDYDGDGGSIYVYAEPPLAGTSDTCDMTWTQSLDIPAGRKIVLAGAYRFYSAVNDDEVDNALIEVKVNDGGTEKTLFSALINESTSVTLDTWYGIYADYVVQSGLKSISIHLEVMDKEGLGGGEEIGIQADGFFLKTADPYPIENYAPAWASTPGSDEQMYSYLSLSADEVQQLGWVLYRNGFKELLRLKNPIELYSRTLGETITYPTAVTLCYVKGISSTTGRRQMLIAEDVPITYHIYSVSTVEDPYFGECLVYNYEFYAEGVKALVMGDVSGGGSVITGSPPPSYGEAVGEVSFHINGQIWYSRRFGLIKDERNSEQWHATASWSVPAPMTVNVYGIEMEIDMGGAVYINWDDSVGKSVVQLEQDLEAVKTFLDL